MTLKIKCLMYKPEDLSLIPRTHRKMGENQLHKIVLRPSGVHRGTCPPSHHTHSNNKGKEENWGGWLVRNTIKGQRLASTCTHANPWVRTYTREKCFYKGRSRIDVDRLFLGLQGSVVPSLLWLWSHAAEQYVKHVAKVWKLSVTSQLVPHLKLQFFRIEIHRKTPVKVPLSL